MLLTGFGCKTLVLSKGISLWLHRAKIPNGNLLTVVAMQVFEIQPEVELCWGLDEVRHHSKLLGRQQVSLNTSMNRFLSPLRPCHTFPSPVSLLSHVPATQVYLQLVAPFSSVAAVAFPWQCCADCSAWSVQGVVTVVPAPSRGCSHHLSHMLSPVTRLS